MSIKTGRALKRSESLFRLVFSKIAEKKSIWGTPKYHPIFKKFESVT